jgi:hypothetical protein
MTVELYRVLSEDATVLDTYVSEASAIYRWRRDDRAERVVDSVGNVVEIKTTTQACFIATYESLTGNKVCKRIPLVYGMSREDMLAKAARYTPRVNYMLMEVSV